ncbi:MAG: ubiquinone biosynthesis accessory factor UbiJ [Aeromonas sp.]
MTPTPEPWLPWLLAAIETSLNHLLRLDATSAARLQPLIGRVVKLELRGAPALWLVCSGQHVDVLAAYGGEADASLCVGIDALSLLREPNAVLEYIRRGEIDAHGDLALLQALAALVGELAIDWEEHLSRYVGDAAAHTLLRSTKLAHSALRAQADGQLRQLADFVTEEVQLAPPPLAIASFCDDVSDISAQVNALETRVANLAARLAQHSPAPLRDNPAEAAP